MSRNCDPQRIEDYFDRLLADDEMVVVEKHLEECERCRVELSALQAVDEKVAEAWNSISLPPVEKSLAGKKPELGKRNSRTQMPYWIAAASLLLALACVYALFVMQKQKDEKLAFPDTKSQKEEVIQPDALPVVKAQFHGESMGGVVESDPDFTIYQVIPTQIEITD